MEAQRAPIFIIASAVPYRSHGVEGVSAVHVILNEIIRALQATGFSLCLQVLFGEGEKLRDEDRQELENLRDSGFEVLPPLTVPSRPDSLLSRVRLLAGEMSGASTGAHYPAYALRREVFRRIAGTRSGAVLTIWSPEGVAATHGTAVPRIVYHGDIDFAPWQARSDNPDLFPVHSTMPGGLARRIDRLRLAGFRRAHMRLMQSTQSIACVTASNAAFYSRHRHPRSIYVPNTWTDEPQLALPPAAGPSPVRIIGHAGYLDRTGSTFGLQFLLREVMPALDSELAGIDFSIHIIGKGNVAAPLRQYLNHPRLVLKGFVEDFNSELRGCSAFLMLNNAGAYNAAYTRHVLAWSMGLCLVAHSNSRLAIPEMQHMKNCLLADSGSGIAAVVREAITNPALNASLRSEGRATYERYFTPAKIAGALASELDNALRGGRSAQ